MLTGIVSTTVGHPIDTIRVIQQVTNTSTMEAMQKLYTKDKVSKIPAYLLYRYLLIKQ